MLAATLAKRVQALRVAQALTARQRTLSTRTARQRTLATRKPREKLYSITGTTQGTTSTSQTRGHTLRTDTPPSGGGKDTAPQPVETLLAALIGCEGATADFVARMLRKLGRCRSGGGIGADLLLRGTAGRGRFSS